MTISSETRKAGPFSGNGIATSFPFDFKIFAKTDLQVVRTTPAGDEEILTLDSDYSVTMNPDQDSSPGGSITYPLDGSPLPFSWLMTLVGNIDLLQPTDITNQGGFYPRVIENALDRQTMQIQQLAEGLSRAVKVPVSGQTPPEDLLEDIKEDVASAHASALSAQEAAAAAEESASRVDLGALDDAVQQTGEDRVATAADRAQTGIDAASAEAAAAAVEGAASIAQHARNTWPSTEAAIGQGVAGFAALVGGSGGTNGTFPLAYSGGTQVLAPQGYFVVAAGAVVQVVTTLPGYYSAGSPTVSFAASAGLIGASATVVMAPNTPVGGYFYKPASGSQGRISELYRVDSGPVATYLDSAPSAALFDLNGDRYAYGKRVSIARVDAANRVGDVITEDGYLYAKFAIRGVGPVAFALAADGFCEIDVTGPFSRINWADGGQIDNSGDRYYDAGDGLGMRRVVRGYGDSAYRGAVIELDDGTVVIPKLVSSRLSSAGGTAALQTSAHLFDVVLAAGFQRLRRTVLASGVSGYATPAGSNAWAPRLSADGGRVVYLSDRSGVQRSYYQLLDGSKFGGAVEHPVRPNYSLMPLGDSLTAADYASVVSSATGIPMLVASTSETAGIGSQVAAQIAARYGAAGLSGTADVTCSVAGGSLAAGTNYLTALSIMMLSRASDSAGAVRSLRASILGVVGALTSTQTTLGAPNSIAYAGQGYIYAFTPDGGQTLPVSVPAGSVLRIDPEVRQDSCLLVWIGRNNVAGATGWQAEVKVHIAAVVAAYKPVVRQIVVLGVTNATDEPTGSANHTGIVALNSDLAALYPDNYFDVRAVLNTGTGDDTPNPTYMADSIHYNGAGKTLIGNAVGAFIITKGWAST